MFATVLVVALANQIDTRAKKLVLVQLSFFWVINVACNLVYQRVEHNSASSCVVWDLSEGISVIDVVVRQRFVISELGSIEHECFFIWLGTAVFMNLCLKCLDFVTKLAINFVSYPF